MSTIPSTFNAKQVFVTILGGMEEPSRILMDVSCIVVKRTVNQYRSQVLRNLLSCGFKKIVSVEILNPAFNTETLSLDFPEVKFVRAHGKMSDGDLVNLGMGEIDTPYALVLHDDLCVQDFRFTRSLAQKLSDFGIFCVAARLLNNERQGIPVRFTPNVRNSVFDVESSLSVVDKSMTLYPFDLAGFYNVGTFKSLGGFDHTIESPYWQEIDLFFRAWLWGEKILLSSAFTLSFFDMKHTVPCLAVRVEGEKTVAYTGDTVYNDNIPALCRGADLLLADTSKPADFKGPHMNIEIAKELNKNYDIKILSTHLSPDYDPEPEFAAFPGISVAHEGETYEI